MIVALHACLGDGTINLYEGPAGPETEKAIAAVREHFGERICEPNPSVETIQASDGGDRRHLHHLARQNSWIDIRQVVNRAIGGIELTFEH